MKELKLFKVLILKKEYFKAHEVLEEVWQKIRKNNNKFAFGLKGLVNGAVALELIKRKRESFKVPLKNFYKYKAFYKGEFLEIYLFLENILRRKGGVYL
jgi:predicted metal-dependent hydrolase